MWEQEDGDVGPEPMERMPLTPKQKAALDFVTKHIDACGYAPTVREVADHFGIARNAAECRLQQLFTKGYVVLYANLPRGIALPSTEQMGG